MEKGKINVLFFCIILKANYLKQKWQYVVFAVYVKTKHMTLAKTLDNQV